MALIGDAKQAMGEGKSGPVETGLVRMVSLSRVIKPSLGIVII